MGAGAGRRLGVAAVLALVVLSVGLVGMARAAAVSSPSWVPVSPRSKPSARVAPVAAYDPATQQFVLFGGADSQNQPTGGTWLWAGLTWLAAKPANSPSPRFSASMASDAASGQLVLFGGGAQNAVYFNVTWTWNDSNWVQLHPATSPPFGFASAMAYDPATRQIVLFGGQRGTTYSNSTWVWTGSNWQQMTPTTVPGAREGASMAWDPATSQLVMFGGRQTGSAADFGDTWVWNGTNWLQQHPATSPPARNPPSWCSIRRPRRCCWRAESSALAFRWSTMCGRGRGRPGPGRRRARALPPRAGAVAGYDVPTDQLLVFGGDDEGFMALDDTWLWSRFAIAEPFLPPGTVGLRYPGQLDAVAGSGAVVWSVSAGVLPTGLSLTQTGALVGTRPGCLTGTP